MAVFSVIFLDGSTGRRRAGFSLLAFLPPPAFGSTGMSGAAMYECPACMARIPADRPLWRCDCGSHLNLTPGRGLVRGEIAAGEASLWRYRAALALREAPVVSLGEGWTPL